MRELFKVGGLLQSVRKFTVRDSPTSFFPPLSVLEAERSQYRGERILEFEMEYYAADGEEPLTVSREVGLAFGPET
jgi:hypothetical protein